MRAANRDLMRAINRCNILRTIRLAGSISRRDISQQTGLSQATITGITAEFIEEGLIYEKETQETTTGRPPVLLALNPDGAFVAGAYVSSESISVVVVNLEARVMGSHVVDIDSGITSPKDIADLLASAVHTCCTRQGFIPEDISGLGIGIPGLVNNRTGMVRFHPGFNYGTGWEDVPFGKLVEQQTGFQTFIENSSNTLAIYDHWFGAARGVDNFLVVTLEHGVGLGIFVDGHLLRGYKGIAGEFGHIQGGPEGPACRCGLHGCLESVASNISILREARELAAKGLWTPPNPDRILLEDVILAAQNGQTDLQNIYTRTGGILGSRISDLIRLFDPQTVIISGKGSLASDMLFKPLFKAIESKRCNIFGELPTLLVQPWQVENYARGAGALVLQMLHQSCAIPDS
ncbi:MAG: ROK family protein [Desulfovibrio sp.]|uniref:ROK family protein n=1 Tax=Desulfovibrio sp. 7SRBS1 TaxID=3378064 RepID=UPI003B3EF2BC